MITCNILFSGIGAQEAALKRLGLNFKVIGISEIDKYAIQSYEAINGPTHNYGDITQIERLDYADLWTYSSPCQDFSTAGKQKGIYNADGSLTRSGLLKHVERLLTDSVLFGTQPKYLLMENVKGLVSKKFKPDFLKWLDKLEQLGYNNYWQVLNAKDYGVPQNRERVFVVSIRKDVDTKGYKFPEKIPLTRKLKDVLESVVDEKYYLSDKAVKGFLKHNSNHIGKTGFVWKPKTKDDIANTLRANGALCSTDNTMLEPLCAASRGRNPENPSDGTAGNPTEQMLEINYTGCTNTLTTVQKDNYLLEPSGLYIHESDRFRKKPLKGLNRCLKATNHDAGVIQVGNIVDTGNWDNPQRGRIYSPSGCSPALTTMQGGGLEPKILFIGNIYESKGQNGNVYDVNGICPTISSGVTNTKGNGGIGSNNAPKVLEEGVGLNPLSRKLEFSGFKENCPSLRATDYKCPHCYSDGYRIRKLTPRECWRLMGFTDVEFDCAQMSGMSNTQLYKQAGNSIVVDVLVGIFKELFSDRL